MKGSVIKVSDFTDASTDQYRPVQKSDFKEERYYICRRSAEATRKRFVVLKDV